MPGLSNQMVDVLTYIEQCWFEDGSIPTNERLNEETGVTLHSIQNYWKDENFRLALAARGITFNGKNDKGKALSMKQLALANVLMNTMDKRSIREKCKELELTPQQVAAWMRSPAFQDHLRKRAETMYEGSDPVAFKGLVSAVETGDLNALKLFFEMRGIYNPKLQIDVDISVVLVRVVEILSKHIKDPAMLNTIASEMDALVAGPSSINKPALL